MSLGLARLVYVFGGLPARFLAADVYFARVPAGELTNHAPYEYWAGGGEFDSDPDLAAPLLEGGTAPSVAYDAGRERWLMAYSPPLSVMAAAPMGLLGAPPGITAGSEGLSRLISAGGDQARLSCLPLM